MRAPIVLLAALTLLACKKSKAIDDAGPSGSVVVAAAPDLPPPAFGDPAEADDARAPVPPTEEPQPNFELPTTVPGAPGATASAKPAAVDPFESATASVRAAAVGCFAGQEKGEYSATISVVITPAGNVSRVEASSSISDPAVTKCLEQAATRSYPSTEGGKKLSIDVRVKG